MSRPQVWSKLFTWRALSRNSCGPSRKRRLIVETLEDRFCLSAYHVAVLGSLGTGPVTPTAINDSGQVVGYGTSGGQTHAFLYTAGSLSDLGTLGGDYSYAFGLNDLGQVVGEARNASGVSHAFLYSAGSMSDLGTLGGSGINSAATAINNAGQIAGYSQTSGGSPNFAFLYSDGSMTTIGSFGDYSNAYAMNEAPQIVGHSSGQGFIYSGGSMSPIPNAVAATGINESGQVTGYTFGGHAFVYSGGATTDLGTLGGSFTVGRAINDLGQIVGDNGATAPGSHAFLYSGGVMQDLNSLVGPGYEIYAAFAINNAGQIAAYGIDTATSQTHGLLLSPNQPPTANAGGPYTVAEGSTVSLTGSGSDPNGDPLTFAWDLDNNGSFETPGQNVVFSAAGRDGPDSQTVAMRVTDSSGASATATVSISITNAPPAATNNTYATAQATLVSGNVITDDTGSGADSDPAGAFDPLTVSGFTSPSNGALLLNADGSFTYAPDSTFSGSDSFNYTISDADGGIATATVTINVAPAAAGSILTIPDTCLGGTALLVTGTSANDTIMVEPGTTTTTLNVTFNGVTSSVSKPSGRIIVMGGTGDDNLQVAGAITNQAWLYGDAGNDRLKGGAGHDLLLGGDGNDLLVGGSGRDVLIGGNGADRIVGNADDDILIAGTTLHDAVALALCAIMDEWTRTDRTYEERVKNLSDGGGLNGTVKLVHIGENRTVFDDNADDVLTGSAGLDWFFFDPNRDRATDLNDEIFASDLEFILQ